MEYGLIFDMDGVLVDSNPFHRISWKNFLERKGYPYSEELFDEVISGRTGSTSLRIIMGEELPEAQIPEYLAEIDADFQDIFGHTEQAVNFPGLYAFLDELKNAGFKTALATSAPSGNVTISLKKLDLEDYFSVIIDKHEVTRGKPDPEVYLTTLARLGVSKDRCFVIEDSRAGVQAALGAGLKVIGISTSHTPEELLKEGVSLVVEDFTHLSVEKLLNLCL